MIIQRLRCNIVPSESDLLDKSYAHFKLGLIKESGEKLCDALEKEIEDD